MASPGKARLVILFAKRPLRNHPDRLAPIEGKRPQLPARLVRALGQEMIPLSDIEFNRDQMAFQVNTRTRASIVPLSLEVNSTAIDTNRR
jgi:hypothetical protein